MAAQSRLERSMIVDFWLITTDTNGAPKSADNLPVVVTSANVIGMDIVSAGVGIYSVRATLTADSVAGSALIGWEVDTVSYFTNVLYAPAFYGFDELARQTVSGSAIEVTVVNSPPITVTVDG